MSLLSSVLGFQYQVRTPVGYAPGVTSALYLGYGVNSKMSASSITNGLEILRDGDRATVSSKVRNTEMRNTVDQLQEIESTAQTINDDLQIAKDNFATIKSNVDQIKDIVTQAQSGSIIGADLDAQQVVINDLVSEINELVETTTLNGNKVFDGTYDVKLQTGLGQNDYFDINFRQGNLAAQAPDLINEFIAPNGDIDDYFSIAFANDDYIVATAPLNNNEDPEGLNDVNGSVYIYDADTRDLIREITSPLTGVTNERFGVDVDIQDNKIIIGTRSDNDVSARAEDQDFTGRAFLYDISNGNQLAEFTHPDAWSPNARTNNSPSNFGSKVQLQGNSAFVFLPRARNTNIGELLEFDRNGNYIKTHTSSTSEIGFTFQITDEKIINGNANFNDNRGQIEIIDRDTGNIYAIIESPDLATQGQLFGNGISIFGDKMLVGAPGRTTQGALAPASYEGKAYLYDISNLDTTGAVLEREFTPPAGSLDGWDRFGGPVKLTGNYAIIGASGDDDFGTDTGATYVFDFNSGDLVFKAGGFTSSTLIGNRLFGSDRNFNGGQGKGLEYDFLSGIEVSETGLNLRTDSVTAGSLGAFSLSSLDKISISENIGSLGEITGLADLDTVSNMQAMSDNLVRMEAILNSTANRVENELANITDKKSKALDEFFATLDTTNGGKNSVVQDTGFYYHPSPLPITTTATYAGSLLGNMVGLGFQGTSAASVSSLLP